MNGRLSLQKNDNQNYFQLIFRNPWPYWVGGIALGIVNIIYTAVTGKYWAISSNLARWGAWILQKTGVKVTSWDAWNYYSYTDSPWLDRLTWSNLGIIAGAFIAILLAGQFKIKKIKNNKLLFTALLGGWLMGYGSRVAIGCNIGGMFSAISSLAVNGWIYLPFVILGILTGSKLLSKLMLK